MKMKTLNDEYSYLDINIAVPAFENIEGSITKERVKRDVLNIYKTFCSSIIELNIFLSNADLIELSNIIIEDLKERVKQDPIALSEEFIYSLSKSFKVIFYHRIAHLIFNLEDRGDKKKICQYCAFSIAEYASITCCIEIHPEAKIGRRFVIDHGINTLIGATSIIGDDCTLLQNVVLGARRITFNEKGKRHPTIGNNVHISGGVRLLGPITIGNNVVILPDCLIYENIKDNTIIKLKKVILYEIAKKMTK